MNRYEKVWAIRRVCVKGSNNKLWNDHGDLLKRVVGYGVAVPTRIELSDVLLAWKLLSEKQGMEEGDDDAANVVKEAADRMTALWDMHPDDLNLPERCMRRLAASSYLCVRALLRIEKGKGSGLDTRPLALLRRRCVSRGWRIRPE